MNIGTFRVGGIDYTAESIPKLHAKYELFGQVTYSDSLIQIDAELAPDRANETLIHELLHACLFEAGYTQGQDEDLVTRLSAVVHGMLRDNDFGFMRKETEESK